MSKEGTKFTCSDCGFEWESVLNSESITSSSSSSSSSTAECPECMSTKVNFSK